MYKLKYNWQLNDDMIVYHLNISDINFLLKVSFWLKSTEKSSFLFSKTITKWKRVYFLLSSYSQLILKTKLKKKSDCICLQNKIL